MGDLYPCTQQLNKQFTSRTRRMEVQGNNNFVNIPDHFPGYSKELFCIPKHYDDSISSVLIPHGVIQERIKKIARDILKDVLKENEAKEDPTENICLNDTKSILSKEE